MEEGKRFNILMVDDEPANLLALEALLEPLGHGLVKAQSGKEALRWMMRQDFALILMDVLMPGMDGFETVRMIRERERSRATPVIFLTAVGRTQAEVFRGYEVGAVDYLMKPLVPEILRSKVRVFLELHEKTEEVKEMNALLERRVLERTADLRRRGEELARSNAELQQFAYAVSHDLQEPLRTITSFLQLLERKSGGKLEGEPLEYLRIVVESSRRLHALIHDLLRYIQLGARPPEPEEVDLEGLVSRVELQLAAAISEKEALLSRRDLPKVMGDPVLLSQLFQNLVSNALKFCRDRRPEVEVGGREEAGEWVLWVKDNGIGIEPPYHERVFRIFQRLHTREEYPGTGMGLAICKKIVDRHGGRIWVESRGGDGTTFFFTLPKTGLKAPLAAPAA